MPLDRQRLRHRQESEGTLGNRKGDCLLFCEGFLNSGRHELLPPGMKELADVIFTPTHQHGQTSVNSTAPTKEA